MKGIVHIRVDDRLIHGQVATRWVSHFNANRIMVIDDAVAANDVENAAAQCSPGRLQHLYSLF